MPKHANMTCPAGQWIEATGGDTDAITLMITSGDGVLVAVTAAAITPSGDDVAAFRIDAGAGVLNELLSDLAPGIDTPRRVFVRAGAYPAVLMVSHA